MSNHLLTDIRMHEKLTNQQNKHWELEFQDGTLVVQGAELNDLPDGFQFDHRIQALRGRADLYPWVVYRAIERKISYQDNARRWIDLEGAHHVERTPRDYQREAVVSWIQNNRRGSIVLPTGSGKTFVAELCIAQTMRPTMVIAPTLDLVGQWYDRLKIAFQQEIGVLGGGCHEILPLTVSTYDSAHLHLGKYGNRFCLLIFDEVHHLPAPAYLDSTRNALAPFRLGLTATLEREDGREALLQEAIGPVVYRKEITELSGSFLASYETVKISIELKEKEKKEYEEARKEYTDFLRQKQITMGGYGGWNNFIRVAARSSQGRSAFQAYLKSKQLAQSAQGKIECLERLIHRHKGAKMIIFTNDNSTAYKISKLFLLPCITHQTNVKERRELLGAFAEGRLPIMVTSRVLNEGVDIPAAEIAVVLSGTGTVREHVQRLGRILRPMKGKQAILYELVAQDTAEEYTSQRRRRHDAYK